MKTLLLMRHAKSSWKDKNLKDTERPLSKRGKRNAVQIGKLLADNELKPELILSSPVRRAQETAGLLVETFDSACETIYMDRLYMAEPDIILETLMNLPDTVERVMVVGHNPGMECLMQLLTGQIASLPTAGFSNISLSIASWKELGRKARGELIQLWRPAENENFLN